jgi:excinuclease UvrABC helicase subunit UvrB
MRDTARNLRVLDFCGKFATDEHDQLILEQYRPYIIMMNCRAEASIHYNDKDYKPALSVVEKGLDNIREFFARFGQNEAFDKSNEVRVLKKFAREIRRKIPMDPMTRLQLQLDKAIKTEQYEEAAKLRDEIKRMQTSV